MKKTTTPRVAYFSMEIALEPDIPTYSGGLGILAGDTLRSAADLGVPLVAVTLAYRKGYFRQILDSAGNQFEQPQEWNPEQQVTEIKQRVTVEIEGRQVSIRAWKYTITGMTGEIVPVYLLDTDVPENSAFDRSPDRFALRRRSALSPGAGNRARPRRFPDDRKTLPRPA